MALSSSAFWLSLLLACHICKVDGYKAAVYDYSGQAVPQDDVRNRSAALQRMYASLEILEEQATRAGKEGADIFVFPEYGLSGRLVSRTTTFFFLETIPDPTVTTFCPCSAPPVVGQEVLRRLSCTAKNTSIYVAANMGDKQPCLLTDVGCPFDGHYQYNTEVVFDTAGCLVARYHKKHLFELERLRWNEPNVAEVSYFDTDFGRFGLMICFDAVFRSPAVDLVEKYNVTDIVFSTAWMNVFPHYISVAYHSGWARTMRVNYLMSNLHYVSGRFVGSGIFSPNGVIDYVYNLTSPYGTLVVANVPEIKADHRKEAEMTTVRPPQVDTRTPTALGFSNDVFYDSFAFIPLIYEVGAVNVCHKDVCCSLEYARSNTSEFYALGAFSGMHYKEGEYFLEVCLLVHCKGEDKSGCGTQPAHSTAQFDYIKLTGTMKTKYAFPQVVTSGFDFSKQWVFDDYGMIKTITISNKTSVLSVVLMGRNFDKDPSNKTPNNSAMSPVCSITYSLLLVSLVCYINL